MSLLSILNPLSWFTSSSKNNETVVSTAAGLLKDASSGIDKCFYTDEEQADDQKETLKMRIQAKKDAWNLWLQAIAAEHDTNSPRSRTRRFLAIAITVHWLLMMDAAVVLLILGKVKQAMPLLDFLPIMTVAVAAVLTWYFGPNQVANAAAKFLQIKKNIQAQGATTPGKTE